MSTKTFDVQDSFLFSYVIASSDMRYVEVNNRELHLRSEPELGPVIQGEIAGCGPSCDADLNQVLLEYAVSCENCRDRIVAGQTATSFGERLAKILIVRLFQESPSLPVTERVTTAYEVILNSMTVPFNSELKDDFLRYDLDYSPIHKTIGESGFTLGMEMAGRSFISLCQTILQIIAPDWELLIPTVDESDAPLRRIHIARR